MAFLLPVLLLGVMYMLLIRPQQQRVRNQRALVSSLQVGDQIVTIGGIIGQIVRLDDETADVEVSNSVVITVLRPAINRKYEPPGSASFDDPPDVDEVPDARDGPEAGA